MMSDKLLRCRNVNTRRIYAHKAHAHFVQIINKIRLQSCEIFIPVVGIRIRSRSDKHSLCFYFHSKIIHTNARTSRNFYMHNLTHSYVKFQRLHINRPAIYAVMVRSINMGTEMNRAVQG